MIRSPLFYVGDKYKLVSQLLKLFPKNINNYYEPFLGGGSSQMQVTANTYFLNDIDKNIITLHKLFLDNIDSKEQLINELFDLISYYHLTCSYLDNSFPANIKKQYPKTYLSKLNKKGYKLLKNDYNNENKKDIKKLYLLLIYGFNHMIRFNKNGIFNLPVGNVDFNKNTFNALNSYFKSQKNKKIFLFSEDFEEFINKNVYSKEDFIYLDPPYLISESNYNLLWNEQEEKRLYKLLDTLNEKGVRFGITNLVYHKGKTNHLFLNWSKKYKKEQIFSNYISFNNNMIKKDSKEFYVYNY